MKREKKPSPSDEPSSRDKLSGSFLAALEKDWEANGSTVIEQIRRDNPVKYGELIARLVPMDLSPPASPYARAKSVKDIGKILLQEVGLDEWFVTDRLIDEALAAQEKFIAELQSIAAKAEH